jgi:hypothetical protein
LFDQKGSLMARINLALELRRKRRYRLRSRTTKFIPDADSDFAHMARTFASYLKRHADRFVLAPEFIAAIDKAVDAYRDALSRTLRPGTCGPMATMRKNTARQEAEQKIRAAARVLRADDSLTGADRLLLRITERPKKLKRRKCPNTTPQLRFVGSTLPDGSGPGKHILEYCNEFDEKDGAKPHGAVRLELFAEIVPAGEPIPKHPAERSGRLPYVRSFTTKRMEVEFPIAVDGTPMLVVYWGRWADSKGEVGRFSKTCVARVEGWTSHALPAASQQRAIEGQTMKAEGEVEVRSDARYFIAERQVHERYLERIEPGVPDECTIRQLEASEPARRVVDDRRLLDAA